MARPMTLNGIGYISVGLTSEFVICLREREGPKSSLRRKPELGAAGTADNAKDEWGWVGGCWSESGEWSLRRPQATSKKHPEPQPQLHFS